MVKGIKYAVAYFFLHIHCQCRESFCTTPAISGIQYSGKVVFDQCPCGPLPLSRQHAHGQSQARMHWGRGGQWNETIVYWDVSRHRTENSLYDTGRISKK
jgi:hypothetical protein